MWPLQTSDQRKSQNQQISRDNLVSVSYLHREHGIIIGYIPSINVTVWLLEFPLIDLEQYFDRSIELTKCAFIVA